MKKINGFVSKLSRGYLSTPSEMKDFKEEIKSNLLISVKELIAEGYEEKEALNISISRLGDINQLKYEMNHLYNLKRIFEKWLLKVAIFLGVLGVILHLGGFLWEQYLRRMEVTNVFDIVHKNIGTFEQPVTKEMEDQLEMTFKGTVLVKAIGIQKEVNEYKPKYCYIYPKDAMVDDDQQIFVKDNFFFVQAHWNDRYTIPNTKDAVFISLTTYWFSDGFYIFAKTLLILYWILFALWASVEVLYNEKNKKWIILFFIFNFIGYAIYKIVDSISKKSICLKE